MFYTKDYDPLYNESGDIFGNVLTQTGIELGVSEAVFKICLNKLMNTWIIKLWYIKENIKALRHGPLWGESTGDRWFSSQRGQ